MLLAFFANAQGASECSLHALGKEMLSGFGDSMIGQLRFQFVVRPSWQSHSRFTVTRTDRGDVQSVIGLGQREQLHRRLVLQGTP